MRKTAALLGLLLVVSTPVWAAGGDEHGTGHGTEHGTEHGANDHGANDHGGDHGANAGDHGAGAHGDSHEGGHGHYEYTADADGDGTPNWLDTTDGTEKNEHFPLYGILFHAINLLILAGILVWFGRRPISDALANRALAIRKELTDSARLRDEARQRDEELAARLDKIEAEISGMRTEAEQEAAKAEAALVTRAHAEAERIQGAAERSIRDEVQRARAALKRDAVALAVELAEGALKERVNADHQQQLARDFLDSLQNGGVNRV
ncbi:MAG: ATP synthase F0 subunit B [Myxococcota bacterium]